MPWIALGTLKGADGDSGTITDVTVIPLAEGAAPTITLSGPPEARSIELGIPKGDTGDPATNLVTSVAGKQGIVSLVKGDVGLANVDNTSDTDKPVSTAQQSALDLKAPLASPAFTGTPTGITKSHVGLGDVDNTADSAKPVSTAQQAALDLKAPLASPAFTGTPTGITKAHVGLGSVDNTSDADKPVSTAQATALASKADLVGGFVPTAQLPPLAVNEVFVVASEAAMLALTAQRGDMAIRETGRTYVLSSDSPTTLADWKEVMAAGQVTSVAGKTGVVSLVKADVGLANVDNTSDANKPVSTAQQTALDLKSAVGHTHTASSISDSTATGRSVITAADATAARTAIGAGTSNLVIGTTSGTAADAAALATSLGLKANLASPTFTGTVGGITKSMVGLANVDNTADTAKPVSTAQQTALDLKAPLASPTFTGTVSGVTKTHVGLGNVDNTSDANKPVSTAQQTALDLKAPLASPALTGTPTGPTATVGTNTTQLSTTAFVAAGLALKINTSAIPTDLGPTTTSTSLVTIGQFATAFKRWPFPITYNTVSSTWPARNSVVPSWYTGPAQYEALTTINVSQPVDLVTGDVVVDLYAS